MFGLRCSAIDDKKEQISQGMVKPIMMQLKQDTVKVQTRIEAINDDL